MALVLANRVQETATPNTTVSFTLTGAVSGFQTFAVIGNTNTTYYSATDTAGNWEVGEGTYSTTGPTLTRTTVYASSNSGSAVTFSGTVNVFVTYPSGKSVNLDASGNVSALGTVTSGTWQGSTVGVAYGGTGLTSYTLNGVVYASGTGTLATSSALTFDGTNLINSGIYTAPSNGSGAGTKTTIQGSTGTGQAGASGGNGFIELIGGGGTSTWTSFGGIVPARRRGGINLQAGTAQGDAGGTYVSGSTINISGSAGTNNGTTVGPGSLISITSGSTTKTDGLTSGASTVALSSPNASASSSVTLNAGIYGTSTGFNNGAGISVFGGTATTGGEIRLQPGLASASGATSGKAYVTNPATGVNNEILTTGSVVAVANGGTGTSTPSLVAGCNVTISGCWPNQTISASGGGGVCCATPTTAGIVFGITQPNCTSQNTTLGFQSNVGGSNGTAIGFQANTFGSASVAIGSSAYTCFGACGAVAVGYQANSVASNGIAIGRGASAGNSGIAIGAFTTASAGGIVLNATGSAMPCVSPSRTYINPITYTSCSIGLNTLYYCGFTKEVFNGPAGGGGVCCATPTVAGKVYGQTSTSGCTAITALGYNAVRCGCVPAFPATMVGVSAFTYGAHAIAIGQSAYAGTGGTAVGMCAGSPSSGASLGQYARSENNGVAVGKSAYDSPLSCGNTIVGAFARVCNICFMFSASANVVVGRSANLTKGCSVLIGAYSASCSTYSVAVGRSAAVGPGASNAIAIGGSVTVSGGAYCGVAVGGIVTSAEGTAIGRATSAAYGSVALGRGATASHCFSIAIGQCTATTGGSQLHIKPIRNASGPFTLRYDPTTGEITYN